MSLPLEERERRDDAPSKALYFAAFPENKTPLLITTHSNFGREQRLFVDKFLTQPQLIHKSASNEAPLPNVSTILLSHRLEKHIGHLPQVLCLFWRWPLEIV